MSNKYNEAALLAAALLAAPALAQQGPVGKTGAAMSGATARVAAAGTRAPAAAQRPTAASPSLRPCESVTVDAPTQLTLGKSRVVRLPFPAARLVVGGHPASEAGRPTPVVEAPGRGGARPGAQGAQGSGRDWDGVAETDITLLSPTELYFLGRRTGSMNVVAQSADGRCLVKDIVVTVDPETLQGKLAELMPEEKGIRVRSADNALVLTGTVSDALKLDQVMSVASSYGEGEKVVNLLRINTPQQVMLEVKIAEVSKSILDTYDIDYTRMFTTADGATSKVLSGIFGGGAAALGRFHPNTAGGSIGNTAVSGVGGSTAAATSTLSSVSGGSTLLGLDLQKKDGIVRVLAEPNIMAISGQSASFLSGGKIFIPVAQSRDAGGSTITLEEKEFGVGLRFTPTVLDGTRINLKLVSEASELSQTGSPFSTVNGQVAILPSMTTRRVDTTVQLNDGQSFVIAGLIKNNVNEALSKFPGLGEVPVMGALFRSTEFQNDKTELMFVVTPRLVKPLNAPVALPTDNHLVPDRNDVLWMGSGEGRAAPALAPAPRAETAPGQPPAAQPVPVRTSRDEDAAALPVIQARPVAPAVVQSTPLLPVSARP